MLVRSGPRRRGTVAPWLVVTAPVYVAVFVLAVHVSSLRHRQAELQNAADAAALAGARALADDLLLTDREDRGDVVLARARAAALEFGRHNLVMTRPLELDANAANEPCGEVLCGTLDNPFARYFDENLLAPPVPCRPWHNAVRVRATRMSVAAQATAVFDQDVIGFQIQGSLTVPGGTMPAVPLAPLALLCDPCRPGEDSPGRWLQKDKRSWEYQVLARMGPDGSGRESWRMGLTSKQPEEAPDRIPEMRVTLSSRRDDQQANGRLALVGVSSASEAVRQFGTGVTFFDLKDRGGRLTLAGAGAGETGDNQMTLPGAALSGRDLGGLADALQAIVGQPRVWMLYSQAQTSAANGDSVRVVGFVAARVMSVRAEAGGKTQGKDSSQLTVILQPSMMVTATAVTDHGRRDLGPRSIHNPYVGKVRIVE